jgi:hypothetical protein
MSFRQWSFIVVAVLVAVGCAARSQRMHSFILEIRSPAPGDFEGSYTLVTGKTPKTGQQVQFRSSDSAARPMVFRARARSFAYQLANNGDEPLIVRLVVDGKISGEPVVPPGKMWGSTYTAGR